MTEPRADIGDALKTLIESISPDLRKAFRPSLVGKVVEVHEDDYRVNVVIGQDPDTGLGGLALPNVPVHAAFAQNGYGLWALPEIDAEVTVSFHDGDVTQPYVESPIYFRNQAPGGFSTGTIAIVGKQGQKIEVRPDRNEIVLRAGAIRQATSEQQNGRIAGDDRQIIDGDRVRTITENDVVTARNQSDTIERESILEAGNRKETIHDDMVQIVEGSVDQSIDGSHTQQIAGSQSIAIAFSKRQVVGGSYEILIAATPGIAGSPAFNVIVAGGDAALDSAGGTVGIGANVLSPPSFVNIGSPVSGPVQLGGLGAVGQSAVYGPTLLSMLTALLAALSTLGGTTLPNPAFVAALVPIQTQLASLLSTKVFVSP
jgi:hypothetical protein